MKPSDLRKIIGEEVNQLVDQITEGKGQDLADKYVAKLRSEFRKLNDDELDEFRETIAKALDLKESVNEAKEKFSVIVIQTGEVIDDGLPKDVALKLAAKKKGWTIQIDESVNEIKTSDSVDEGFKFLYRLSESRTPSDLIKVSNDLEIFISDVSDDLSDEDLEELVDALTAVRAQIKNMIKNQKK